ncbi:aldehyde ferredoxin oxidoreductase N-terminal domain-containing protein [Thermodesulfatator autotrophicus]|uniref:Aldehyde:ferredoxin oxidoreductase n=1 Tax=Thermodesulfatator autotrophicus TaxID=1795632 RepID=A0A177E586_9BACT|nr:aldehyde ferredoxin oxidoreductase N-terminal domain-containing protein [Thermodesulfatator autotrophicus]OAG27127.1 aldehyde:ferredoxin oxidoreductase [Thermodesulfatator autotrophicus]
MLKNDPLKRVLYIDLSSKKFWIEERRDLFEKYIGGTGVASALLEEECPKEIDPQDPKNPIILAVGPSTGLFPIVSKTVSMFLSPHNKLLGESHAGGRSAVALRLAGYGAVIIRGKSNIPVYLVIDSNGVKFRDARALWGLSVSETGRFIREREKGSGLRSILRIGRAGETGVTYSCVVTETYRHFGRLGLGALFGYKKLKAIVIEGGKKALPVTDRKLYKETYDDILTRLRENPSLKKYYELGTAVNIIPLNMLGALPTRNLKETRFEKAENICGEYFAENLLGRRLACAHCPMACIHIAALRTPYEDEPYFYKTTFISYDYEPIYATGSMIGVGSAEGVLRLLDSIDNYGFDVMSTGVVLAWTTEAFEKGLINEEHTLGLEPKFGDVETYLKMLFHLANQSNEFYTALARGVDFTSQKYGGEDFALAFGGNEMSGYHTGYGIHITHLTGSRHSHLDSAGYSYDQKTKLKELDIHKLVEKLFKEEAYRQVLSSAICCFFGRSVFDFETLARMFSLSGFGYEAKDLEKLGQDILIRKYHFKKARNFAPSKLRIPRRIFETISPHGKLDEKVLKTAVKLYEEMIEKRGGGACK